MIDNEDTIDNASIKKGASLKLLLNFARPYKWFFIFALGLLIISSSLGVWGAYALGQLAESLLGATQKIWFWGWLVLILELLSVLSQYLGRRVLGFKAAKALLDIRTALFQKLTELPLKYYDTQPLGRIVTRVTHDVETLDDFFTGSFARLLSSVITLIVVFISMLATNYKLGFLMSLAAIPAFLVSIGIRGRIRHWNIEMAKKNSSINALLSEYLSGFGVIRAFGLESWSQKQFDKKVDEHLYVSLRFNITNAWSRPIILFLCYLPLLVLIFWGGKSVFAGTLSLGLFVAFVRYSERFSRPILAIAQEIHMVQTALVNIERIASILNQPTELELFKESSPKHNHSESIQKLTGPIEFKNVFMSYQNSSDSNWVLKNVSFQVQPGEIIGLAGATGSGKTTTLALLSRLYDFQKGEILINGKDIRQFLPTQIRAKIGYVSQDVVIFKGTLRENLCAGHTPTDSEILNTCRMTGLLGIMSQRNLTLDSEILDLGANLSQGEKQLIALTRVLALNPEILVLDEATANIDPELELTIQNATHEVMKNRTCFMIAHRLSTLSKCHRIFVFNNGELVEQGTQSALFDQHGYFYQLMTQSQMGGPRATS